jgi:hypothetical protein
VHYYIFTLSYYIITPTPPYHYLLAAPALQSRQRRQSRRCHVLLHASRSRAVFCISLVCCSSYVLIQFRRDFGKSFLFGGYSMSKLLTRQTLTGKQYAQCPKRCSRVRHEGGASGCSSCAPLPLIGDACFFPKCNIDSRNGVLRLNKPHLKLHVSGLKSHLHCTHWEDMWGLDLPTQLLTTARSWLAGTHGDLSTAKVACRSWCRPAHANVSSADMTTQGLRAPARHSMRWRMRRPVALSSIAGRAS